MFCFDLLVFGLNINDLLCLRQFPDQIKLLCFVPEFLGQNENDLLAIQFFMYQIKMFCFRSDSKQTKSKSFAFVPIISFDIETFFLSFQYRWHYKYRDENPGSIFPMGTNTVIRFLWVNAKFGTCTVVSVNGKLGGIFFMFDIQHCLICRPSDSTVSEDAGIEPRTVATLWHWLSDALTTRLDLIHLLKLKCALSLRLLSSTSVPFTLTTPNLALTHSKKRITVFVPAGKMELGFSSP